MVSLDGAKLRPQRMCTAALYRPSQQAIADAAVDSADVDCVMIGTTQFTNAVIQRRSLLPVGIIRLALPATSAIPPLTDWPDDLITEIGRNAHLVGWWLRI